ncbi:bifunctional homocysteine S-methyltransferase/methylenetetrahydrofolate reductase [Cytobacillus sp. Hm23]
MKLLERLKNDILIADGAMGTLLYSYGVDYCFEELNLTQPNRIQQVHEAYIQAGANVIQTNTYGANRVKLARYDLENKVKEINKAAVQIAKRSIGKSDEHYTLGTIGGIRGVRKSIAELEEIKEAFIEQLDALLEANVDGILLETYYDIEELYTVLQEVRKRTTKPVIAQVSMHEVGVLQDGTPLHEAFSKLEQLGANVIGTNCRLGPYHTIKSLEQVPLPNNAYLSAYPNASLPDLVDGRLIYESDAEYFADAAISMREQGVRLLGGCCGTTPKHIEAMRKALNGLTPIDEKRVKERKPISVSKPTVTAEPHLHEMVQSKRTVIVELDSPKHLDTDTFFKGAQALQQAGVDVITLADNSLATPRISNVAVASILKEKYNIRPLVHITCRDRNIIGLQSHIMGIHTLGINQVLAVTGDPTKVGNFPGATSVYDVSSFELIQMIKQFNNGQSISGTSLKLQTNFGVSAAFNPNVRHLEPTVKRLEKKIAFGADSFISQPVFSQEQIIQIHKATKHLQVPIFLGIMPLTNYRNAQFLHHEVPGIKLADDILHRMKSCGDDREICSAEGVKIAQELIDTAMEYFKGIYLITPFLRYDMTVALTNYIRKKDGVRERKIHHVL